MRHGLAMDEAGGRAANGDGTGESTVDERDGAGWSRASMSVAIAALVGVAIRTAFLFTPAGGLDGDEGVTGIMARRMASGSDLNIFFLGQDYNGSIEQVPQALLFAVGLPVSPLVLRIPQLLLAGVAIYLVYVLGRRLLPSDGHAALAAWLFALGPYFLIWKGARSFGSYSAELLVVMFALLLAVEERWPLLWRSFGIGVCVGLTYWSSFSGFYVLAPVCLWFLASMWREAKAYAAIIGGTIVGAAPVLVWVARYQRIPVPRPGYRPTTVQERFSNLFDEVGREFVGVAHISGEPGWPVTLGRLVLWGLVALLVIALVRRRHGLWSVIRLRREGREPFDLVLLSIPVVVVGYTASRFAWFTTEPRYLFVAFPLLIFGLARLVPRAGAGRGLVGAAVILFVAGPSLTLLVTRADDVPGTRDDDLETVVDLLVEDGTTDVYAPYWTSMPLEFVADDRLTVGTLTEPQRLPEERRSVDDAPEPVWVASRGVNSDDITPMRAALDAAGISHRERQVGDISIFDRFSRDVRPWEIGLGIPFE
jgi:hypothetical protein